VVAALLLVRLADEAGGFLPTGAFESIRADLGLSYTQAGVVLSAIAVGAIAGNGFAVAADHVSRRGICAGGALAYASSLAIFAVADSFAALLAAATVLGVASTAMVDAAEVALVEAAEGDLPRALARQNLLGGIGDLLGPAALIAADALGWSWRVVFAAGAVGLLAYGCWVATLRFPPPAAHASGATARDGIRVVLRDPRVWVVGLLGLLLFPLDEPFLAFLIATLEHRGLGRGAATAVAALAIVGALVEFARRARVSRPATADALVSSAALLVATTLAVLVPWIPLVLVAAFVFGAAIAVFWVTLQAHMFTLHPGRVGTVKAAVTTIELGGFTIPVAAGAVADAAGVGAGLAVFTAVAVALLAVSVLTRAGRRQARSDRAI